MITLSEEEVLSLHAKLLARFGGHEGVRDRKALDAALHTPFQTFDGFDLYPSDIEKAVRLAYGLVKDHPFIDGNKRIGAMVLFMMLRMNDIEFEYSHDDMIAEILSVASGDSSYEDFLSWVNARISSV